MQSFSNNPFMRRQSFRAIPATFAMMFFTIAGVITEAGQQSATQANGNASAARGKELSDKELESLAPDGLAERARQLVAEKPKDGDAHYRLGVALYRLGKNSQAI